MITVDGLGLSFDRMTVLKDISLRVDRGDIAVVLGKNGSGKSVLLKCMAGLLSFQKGEVLIADRPVSEQMYYASSARGDACPAYVFQKGGLFDSMTVYDNVAFGMRRKMVDEESIAAVVPETLATVGLEDAEDKFPSELSGGMQKRVGLARSLCLQPSVILYDDPTAGLDPVLTDSIADLILAIREERSVTSVVVTHDISFAKKIADSVYLLYNNSIVYSGTGGEFFDAGNDYARQFINGESDGPIEI